MPFGGLTAHISGVQTSGDCRVSSAFDDRPAIREECHFIGISPKFQYKVVVLHPPQTAEPIAHLHQINRPVAFMDLHRIPSTQRDMRLAFAREMDEIILFAGATARPRPIRGDLGPVVVPHIERKQSRAQVLLRPNQEL
jgi:hypothetical protein